MISSKSRRALSIFEILVIVGALFVFGTLLYPSSPGGIYPARKTQAKNDATQIASALKDYLTEYGKLPSVQPGNANSAKLMSTLAATLTSDPDNPRQIVFLEVPKAKGHRNGVEKDRTSNLYTSGYKDPWGNEYEIRIDTGIATHPDRPSVQGPSGPVAKPAIVWSRGDPAKKHDYEDKAKWIKSWE